MKLTTPLLAASLVANAALIAVLATQTPHAAHAPLATPASVKSTPADISNALRAALASGDPAAMRAAGLSADLARDLTLGRALARFQEKIRAARAHANDDGRWWRSGNATRNREAELLAQRELSDALLAALGDDLGLGGADSSQLAFLSADKRSALRHISQDYNEMMAKFGTGGIQLASDKEKLRLLRAERDRDIAALLTPAELADYELRTSASAATVRARYSDAIESEADFKKLYALQKAYDEKFPLDALSGRVSPETIRARGEAQAQLQADMRAAVGDDAYAALRRNSDPELRALDSLVTRLGLPAATTSSIATSRDTYAAESQRINADSALSAAERRTKLQALGTQAKGELASTLGGEAADAYAPRASWVGMLQSGIAFSTTQSPGTPGGLSINGVTQSVSPVLPASTPGTRQTVNIVSGVSDLSAAVGGGLSISGIPPTSSSTTQVITISNGGPPTSPPPSDPSAPPPKS